MGSGKTRIGQYYAKKHEIEFIDMDSYIEKENRMKISEMFEKYGEEYFRKAETKAVKELSNRENAIIALGGGTILKQENVDILKSGNNVILYLDVPVAALKERLKNDKHRPILQNTEIDRGAFIEKLHSEREPFYLKAADIVIPAGAPKSVVVERIDELEL